MLTRCLPLATPYDPAEDPPGSVDPLGTVAAAEQLAELLFPGMTARMWRARHLTFAALAAHIADHAAGSSGDEEARLEARLAIERLFVSAIARHEANDPNFRPASRRLPGIRLARRAWRQDDQPLGTRTFIKGQAINGPFGVISRLARNMDVIDDENCLFRNGERLLLAWAEDQKLPGILDRNRSGSDGAAWVARFARCVEGERLDCWPSKSWGGWEVLVARLRPDKMRRRERTLIRNFLADEREPRRRRCFELLQTPEAIASYHASVGNGARGHRDRQMLFSTFRKLLAPAKSTTDREIDFVIRLIEAYERVASGIASVMLAICAKLAAQGRATKSDVLHRADSQLQSIRMALRGAAEDFRTALVELAEYEKLRDRLSVDRFRQLLDDADAGVSGNAELTDRVLSRHTRVQQQKRKGVWIDVDEHHWTLRPGFGNVDGERLDEHVYLHPFRVDNAYSFLADLKSVPAVEVSDGEET